MDTSSRQGGRAFWWTRLRFATILSGVATAAFARILTVLTSVVAVLAATVGLLLVVSGPAAAQESRLSSCPLLLENKSSGPCVVLLQRALNKTGVGYNLDDDGTFGEGTRIAVLDFQGRNGLPADGNAGPQVIRALVGQVGDLSVGDAPSGPAASGDCVSGDVASCEGGAIGAGKPAWECLGEALSDEVTKKIKQWRAQDKGETPPPDVKPSPQEKEQVLKKTSRKEQLKIAKEFAKKPFAVAKIFKCMLWDLP